MPNFPTLLIAIAAAGVLAGCEKPYYGGRTPPGELVPTSTFVTNVLTEHGVVRRAGAPTAPQDEKQPTS